MGPLSGLRVLEFEAIGPVPWAAMMLSDLGADVLRIDAPAARDAGLGADTERRFRITQRGRSSLVLDLKTADGAARARRIVTRADVLLEGLRPGVMEKLGLGPDACLAANPALVYGRMTGWGQTGPWSNAVGHDINYIGLTGALHAIGPADRPPSVPLNLVGDFGGGGLLLAFGVLAALLERRDSGRGQVVDAAMVDGSASLMAAVMGRFQAGEWHDRRESNLLDGGAHFYGTYATADGGYLAVGAIEPRFYAALLHGLGLDAASLPAQHDRLQWRAMRKRFEAIFLGRSRAEWLGVFAGTEACVTPVLSLGEVASHDHVRERGLLVDIEGVRQPAPSPRFSRTPGAVAGPVVARGTGGEAMLAAWGIDADPPAGRC